MKRGPSKGYIKELSDRVASLEQSHSGSSPSVPKKRKHSTNQLAPGTPGHQPDWSSSFNQLTHQTPFAQMTSNQPAHMTNGVSPATAAIMGMHDAPLVVRPIDAAEQHNLDQ